MTYISEGELEARLATYPPEYSRAKLWDQWYMSIIRDEDRWGFDGKNLNETLPEIHPMGIREFLQKW